MAYKTTVFSSTLGDVTLPITATSIDGVNAGANVPLTGLAVNAPPTGSGFVPPVRFVQLTEVSTDSGLPMMTTTASGSLPGINRIAGTNLGLNGVTTSGSQAVTTKMFWELILPMTYVAGAAIPVQVNCVVATAANVTAASTTMTVQAFSVSSLGVETALTVSATQQIPLTTAGTLTFSVSGTGLTAGSRFNIELVMLVTTTTGGASFGQINSVGYVA